MYPKKYGGKNSTASATGGNPSRGRVAEQQGSGKGNPTINQLNKDMANVGLESQEDGWEVYAKKSRNRAGGAPSKPSDSSNASSKAWAHSEGVSRQGWGGDGGAGRTSGNNYAQANDSRRPVGRGNSKQQPPTKSWESQYMAPPSAIPPPLQHGWQWPIKGYSSGSQPKAEELISKDLPRDGSFGGDDSDADTVPKQHDDDDLDDDEDDLLDDSDDFSDDYDSDASQISHETRKKNKWFRRFFEDLDKLTAEAINEPTRQWHCPACHNAPGAIDWYKGLQPLMTHAKTKGATRVKLHRELASLLEEELRRRGTSVVPAGEVFGKWKGLKETSTDHEIVWPPMVVVMNTLLEQDETERVLLPMLALFFLLIYPMSCQQLFCLFSFLFSKNLWTKLPKIYDAHVLLVNEYIFFNKICRISCNSIEICCINILFHHLGYDSFNNWYELKNVYLFWRIVIAHMQHHLSTFGV